MVEDEGSGGPSRPTGSGSGSGPGPQPGARAADGVRAFREPPAMLDRFELVLLLVLATIAVQGLVDVRGSVFAQLFAHAISGLALVAAARASGSRRRWRRAVDVLVIVVLVVSLTALSLQRGAGGDSAVPPETTWLLAAALTPVLIARRVLQHTVVTLQTIMGSVAAYLQIAVAYAFLFQTIDAFTTTPFFGQDVSTTTYMYFSLVTISTVGFGDVVTVTDLGRMAAASEAVVGQVFLVTFVALIVSRFAAGMQPGSASFDAGGVRGPVRRLRTLRDAMDSSQSQPLPPPDPDDAASDDAGPEGTSPGRDRPGEGA